MTQPLDNRLNHLVDRLAQEDFLSGSGIANEISFYIFAYPPEAELRVRAFVAETLRDHLPKRRPGIRVSHVDLFDLVLTYLKQRNLLDKILQSASDGRDAVTLRNLWRVVTAEKLRPLFREMAQPDTHDLLLVTGVGSVYPMLRAHHLLNNAQVDMGHTPLVLFYPGSYSGQNLQLFNQSTLSNNYYRAFQL